MKKLKLETKDLFEENKKKLTSLFPEILTEIEKNGELIKTINVEKLKELVGDFADKTSEFYELSWAGKQNARKLALDPTLKTLIPNFEDSEDFENTDNVYIEGDNLEILKILRKSYSNSIKCIYIDPPYNTRKDFIYKDNFAISKEEEEKLSGQKNKEGLRLFRNNGFDGKYHTNWLNMMYSRLQLAHKLLKKDGIIFISIDDNELDNLKKICDEIFGSENFVGNFIWRKKYTLSFVAKNVINIHEYILCYSKSDLNLLVDSYYSNLDSISVNPVFKSQNGKSIKIIRKGAKHSDNTVKIIPKGFVNLRSQTIELLEDAVFKKGILQNDVSIKAGFSVGQDKLDCKKDLVIFKSKGGIYIDEQNENKSISPLSVLFDYTIDDSVKLMGFYKKRKKISTRNATQNLENLFGIKLFDFPKPVDLIKELIGFLGFDAKEFIVLDFFSGSATTAHAVMKLNAEDGGNRKYIMVQLPELTYIPEIEEFIDEDGIKQKRNVIDPITGLPKIKKDSEARKSGYNYITDIGKERIRRAAKKIKEDNKDKDLSNVDFGFKVFKLSDSIYKDTLLHPGKIKQENLEEFADTIKKGTKEEDILYSVLLAMGVKLSAKIEIKKIQNKKIFFVEDGLLVACFDNYIDLELVRELEKLALVLRPKDKDQVISKFVFKESSIKDDSEMINIMEYLKAQLYKTNSELQANVKLI